MEDREIIDLYWQRDQQAIHETSGKYGGFLWNIAWNILRSHGDAEECVNDTYLRTLPDWTARWKTRRLRHPSARSCAAFPGKTGSCSCGDIGTATPLQALHSGWAVEKAK